MKNQSSGLMKGLVFLLLLPSISFGQELISTITEDSIYVVMSNEFVVIDCSDSTNRIALRPVWSGMSKNEVEFRHIWILTSGLLEGYFTYCKFTFEDGTTLMLESKKPIKNGKSYYRMSDKEIQKLTTKDITLIQVMSENTEVKGSPKESYCFMDLFAEYSQGNFSYTD